MNQDNQNKFLSHPIVIFFIIIRIFSAIYILIDPFWGFFAYLFFDFIDGYMFSKPGISNDQYMKFDRPLDWLGYITMLIVSFDTQFFNIFLILIIIRFIGQVFYMRTNDPKYYIYFPNLFEAFYLWFIIMDPTGSGNITLGINEILFLLVLLIAQLIRELVIHKYQHVYLQKHGQFKIALLLGFPERKK